MYPPLLGLLFGGGLAYYIISDAWSQNLDAALAWGNGWGQVVLLLGGGLLLSFVAPRDVRVGALLLGIGAFGGGAIALFNGQPRHTPLLVVLAIGSFALSLYVFRREPL